MPNSTIPNLVAVVTPAGTDLLGVRQSGDTRDKKLTVTQLLTLIPAHLDPILLNDGSAAAPSYSFTSDPDSGLFLNGADELSLAIGGVEGLRLAELNAGVIQVPNASVAVTAFAGGGQGSAVQLDESYTVIGTVATAGDSVKLPPVFAINSTMYIKNDGANAADVFPASGDDLGAGVDTAVSLLAGRSLSFIATVANATWTQLLVDTTTTLSGGLLTAEYRFSTSIVDADPGPGRYRYNSATPASVTEIFIDDFTDNGVDISNLLSLITTDDRIYLQTSNDSAEFLVFNVTAPITDNTGWFTITGTVEASGDLHSNNAQCIVALQIGGAAAQTPDPILLSDGLVSAPSYSFASDPDSGIFLVGADILGLTAGGIEIARLTEAAEDQFIISPGALLGSAALPALAFGDGDTGFAESIDDTLQLSTAGIARFSFSVTGMIAVNGDGGGVLIASATDTFPTLTPRRNDPDSGIGSFAADSLSLIAGGIEIARLTEAAEDQFIISPGALLGSATLPALAFGDGDSGFFETSDDVLGYAGNGVLLATFHNGFFQYGVGGIDASVPSATVPNLLPRINDPNTGIGQTTADQMSLIAGGVRVANLIEAAGVVQIIVPLQNNAAAPSIAFGDGDSGFYESADDVVVLSSLSQTCMEFSGIGAVPLLGFFATSAVAQPTGVAVTAAGIHAALVTLGLITA